MFDYSKYVTPIISPQRAKEVDNKIMSAKFKKKNSSGKIILELKNR